MNLHDLALLQAMTGGSGGGSDNLFIAKAKRTVTTDWSTSPETVTEETILDGTTYQEINSNVESGKVVFCILTTVDANIGDGEPYSYEYIQPLLLESTGTMRFSSVGFTPPTRTYDYTNLTVYDDDTVYFEEGNTSVPKGELILEPDTMNYEVGGTINGYTVYNLDENSYSVIADSQGIPNMNITIRHNVTVGGFSHLRMSSVFNVTDIGASGTRNAYVLGYFKGNTYTEMAVFDKA